jgi:hypothetical protein
VVKQNIMVAGGCDRAKLLTSWQKTERQKEVFRDKIPFRGMPPVTYFPQPGLPPNNPFGYELLSGIMYR